MKSKDEKEEDKCLKKETKEYLIKSIPGASSLKFQVRV